MRGPVIRLRALQGLGLVVKRASGVLYTNQAGGNSCCQPVEEGVLIPLEEHCGIQAKLEAYFAEHGSNLDRDDADALDRILQTREAPYRGTPTFFLEVDRARLADSMESWLYVTITTCPDEHLVGFSQDGDGNLSGISTLSGRRWHPDDQPELENRTLAYPMSGFGRSPAVLTWLNSD